MPFSRYALETFISDKLTRLTKCGAGDVSKEFPHYESWLSTFGLKVIFHNYPPEEHRPLALQMLRRGQMALMEYSLGYAALNDLVTGKPGRWAPYFRALHHFEATIGLLYQRYGYARKALKKDYFKRDDGSPLDRLNKIHNKIKHEVASGNQPVWISDEGIEIVGAALAFGELEELLREAGRSARYHWRRSSP